MSRVPSTLHSLRRTLPSLRPHHRTATTSTPPPSSAPKTHYLITLLRSPLHLPAPILATAHSLGLSKRLSSSLVPITRENAGFILRIKELVGVRTVAAEEVDRAASSAWRDRAGEGRQGAGFNTLGDHSEGRAVVRVGRERARGEERGFKVVR